MSPVTVLITEDFAPFREFVCRELQRRPGFELVTVADGRAAVQKAEELRPAVILLDIGLPELDGLTAARHIRSRCPESRIVFLTQESSADVVHEALTLGANGYIEKTRALYVLPTVEAILEHRSNGRERRGDHAAAPHHHHHVQFSRDDSTLLDGIDRFVGPALAAGEPAILFGTGPHWHALIGRLCRRGVNVDDAVERGTLTYFDAEEVVSHILANGVESCVPLFLRAIESACAKARPGQRVPVFGEVVSLLYAAGRVDAAVELERAGNEMLRTWPIEIMCAYPLLPLESGTAFKNICAQHTAVAIR